MLVTAVINLAGAGYLLAQGQEAASRTSRWTVAVAFIIPAIPLLGGAVVSKPEVLIDSLVPYQALPLGTAAAGARCWRVWIPRSSYGLDLAWFAEALAKRRFGGAVIAAAFVLVFGLGLILLYGGAFVAPTLQAFLLAAAPALAIGYFMFFVVFVLASAADTQLAAASEVAAQDTSYRRRRPVTAAIIVLAILLAMFVPAPGQIFAVAATIAMPHLESNSCRRYRASCQTCTATGCHCRSSRSNHRCRDYGSDVSPFRNCHRVPDRRVCPRVGDLRGQRQPTTEPAAAVSRWTRSLPRRRGDVAGSRSRQPFGHA